MRDIPEWAFWLLAFLVACFLLLIWCLVKAGDEPARDDIND